MSPTKIPDPVGADNTAKLAFFEPTLRDQIQTFRPRPGAPGTPTGEGLLLTRDQFQVWLTTAPIPTHAPTKRGVFLYTSKQNDQPPVINTTWAQDYNKKNGATHDLRVYSVGFGDEAILGSGATELSTISAATGGSVYFFDPSSRTGATGARPNIPALVKLIRDQAIDYLLGLETVTDPPFVLKSGDSTTFDVCVSELDTTLFLSVNVASLQEPQPRIPNIEIHTSGNLLSFAKLIGNRHSSEPFILLDKTNVVYSDL